MTPALDLTGGREEPRPQPAASRRYPRGEACGVRLLQYVQRRKQAKILDLFGKVDFDPKYDYKR